MIFWTERAKDVIVLILGGGRGSRLDPLTRLSAKPAVPFAGKYRLNRKVEVAAAGVIQRDDLLMSLSGQKIRRDTRGIPLDVRRDKAEDGRTRVTAFLGITQRFEVLWKPEVKKLEGELVVASDANTIATASVGANVHSTPVANTSRAVTLAIRAMSSGSWAAPRPIL